MASTLPNLNPRALPGLRLAVAGGGVLGLSIAALAVRSGAQVTVFEPAALGDNASGVAAGMLSPALEAVLDSGSGADHDLFEQAYAAWPRFAETLGLPAPDCDAGALYLADPAALDRVSARLTVLGVAVERLTGAAARTLQPALSLSAGEALHVRRDGRLDPLATLALLTERLVEAGGAVVPTPCPTPPAPGFDATVLAAGYDARRWIDAAPQVAALQPIKGHVLHFQGGPTGGPVARGPGGYAAPQRAGVIFGATMEPGRDDRTLDPAAVARLHAAALALLPDLADASFIAHTGVRAATPDGRPLVGRVASGVHLAVGARRNGWLLAPLIAAAVIEALRGGPPRAEFAPRRFEDVMKDERPAR